MEKKYFARSFTELIVYQRAFEISSAVFKNVETNSLITSLEEVGRMPRGMMGKVELFLVGDNSQQWFAVLAKEAALRAANERRAPNVPGSLPALSDGGCLIITTECAGSLKNLRFGVK